MANYFFVPRKIELQVSVLTILLTVNHSVFLGLVLNPSLIHKMYQLNWESNLSSLQAVFSSSGFVLIYCSMHLSDPHCACKYREKASESPRSIICTVKFNLLISQVYIMLCYYKISNTILDIILSHVYMKMLISSS